MIQWAKGLLAFALAGFAAVSVASFHTFQIDEIYSNADGTVQYVVLHETLGANGENLLGVHSLKTNPQGGSATTFPFVTNLPSATTANKRVLIASNGFAALGLITPDYVFANGFVPIPAGTINYALVDQVTYTALPTDGVHALNHSGVTIENLATNFAGQTASIGNTCGGAVYPFPYTDVTGVGAAFCPGIMEAYVTGVSKGTTPTTFSPNDTVTRVQMTTFLQRSVDQGLARTSRRAALNQWWTPQGPNGIQIVNIGGSPPFCAADGKNIWVGDLSGHIYEIEASTGKMTGPWTGVAEGTGLLVALGKVWITNKSSPGALYVIDPTTAPGPATLVVSGLGADAFSIAFDGLDIWTANGTGSVSKIDPVAKTASTISTGFNDPFGILFDGTHIWVTDFNAGTLLKLDSSGAIVQTVSAGNEPALAAFDGTNIWVPNHGDSSVTVVQASTGSIVATISPDGANNLNAPLSASFDGERILITNFAGSVTLFKAADLSLIGNFATPSSTEPYGACSDGINFWITDAASGELLRF